MVSERLRYSDVLNVDMKEWSRLRDRLAVWPLQTLNNKRFYWATDGRPGLWSVLHPDLRFYKVTDPIRLVAGAEGGRCMSKDGPDVLNLYCLVDSEDWSGYWLKPRFGFDENGILRSVLLNHPRGIHPREMFTHTEVFIDWQWNGEGVEGLTVSRQRRFKGRVCEQRGKSYVVPEGCEQLQLNLVVGMGGSFVDVGSNKQPAILIIEH